MYQAELNIIVILNKTKKESKTSNHKEVVGKVVGEVVADSKLVGDENEDQKTVCHWWVSSTSFLVYFLVHLNLNN